MPQPSSRNRTPSSRNVRQRRNVHTDGTRVVIVGGISCKAPGAYMVFSSIQGEKYYVRENVLGCCITDVIPGVRVKAYWRWDAGKNNYTCTQSGIIQVSKANLRCLVKENWTALGHRQSTLTETDFVLVELMLTLDQDGYVARMADEFVAADSDYNDDESAQFRTEKYARFRDGLGGLEPNRQVRVRAVYDLTSEIVLRISTDAAVRNLWIQLNRAVEMDAAKLMCKAGIRTLPDAQEKVTRDGPPFLWRLRAEGKPPWYRGALLDVKDCDAMAPLMASVQCEICTFADAKRARITFDSLDACDLAKRDRHELWALSDPKAKPPISEADAEWLLETSPFEGTHESFDFALERSGGQLRAFHTPSRRHSTTSAGLVAALVVRPAPAAWSASADRLPSAALSPEQREALRGMLRRRFAMMDAGAGRGKSHLLLKLAACMARNQSFIVAAMQHKHLSRLRQDVPGLHVTTLHSLANTLQTENARRKLEATLREVGDRDAGDRDADDRGEAVYEVVLNTYSGFNPSSEDESTIRDLLHTRELTSCCDLIHDMVLKAGVIIEEAGTLQTEQLAGLSHRMSFLYMFGHTGQLGPIDWGQPFLDLGNQHRGPDSPSSPQTVFELHTNLRAESASIVTEADRVLEGSAPRSAEHVTVHVDSDPRGEDLVKELIRVQQGSRGGAVVAIVATNGYKGKFGVRSLYEIYFTLTERRPMRSLGSMHPMWCGRWMMTNDRVVTDNGTILTQGVSIGRGTMGVVESATIQQNGEPRLKLRLEIGDNQTFVLTKWEDVKCVAPGSIITGNKAQGCEWDHVLVMIPRVLGEGPWCRNWVYMAMTRAKRRLQLYVRGGASLDWLVGRPPPRRTTHLNPEA